MARGPVPELFRPELQLRLRRDLRCLWVFRDHGLSIFFKAEGSVRLSTSRFYRRNAEYREVNSAFLPNFLVDDSRISRARDLEHLDASRLVAEGANIDNRAVLALRSDLSALSAHGNVTVLLTSNSVKESSILQRG